MQPQQVAPPVLNHKTELWMEVLANVNMDTMRMEMILAEHATRDARLVMGLLIRTA